jgi:protein-S-isoprenylcysteine O-methyltransferase Ste14
VNAIFGFMILVGAALEFAAILANPKGAISPPEALPEARTTRFPYSILKHPMYIGTWLYVVGLAGYGSGPATAASIGVVLALLYRDWICREEAALWWDTQRAREVGGRKAEAWEQGREE